jgi:photosystem II stability/assembly factor-like uncharacterized protein
MAKLTLSWEFVSTGVANVLFGVDVVDHDVVWAAGRASSDGVAAVVRTLDGGRSWRDITPPDGRTLDFHDVEAFDRDHALVLAVGRGRASKIFRTEDGGASWRLVFDNPEAPAFYDGIAFFDSDRGLALSDPVAREFRILATGDGGRTWNAAPSDRLPDMVKREVARASGTSIVAIGPNDAWFGTAPLAARSNSRVFHTRDGGRSWTAVTAPIPGQPQFGVSSLAFPNRLNGMAIGGGDPDTDQPSVAAVTSDEGESWTAAGLLSGFRLNLARVPALSSATAVAVGPTGSDYTTDEGRTWHKFDPRDLRGISCLPDGTCWAVGADGMAARLVMTTS